MDIAIFETSSQMLAVREMCNNNASKLTKWLHVGGYTLIGGSPTDWYWVTTGERVAYAMKWNPSEPNNMNGVEQCLSLENYMYGYNYNDIDCYGHSDQFICEKVL